ncbi:MAG: EFR1 family ferrodoxin [Spirochaetes bacterium]|nr:EFR1 family ferrodoxin [Spirochaetota bacterium]
MYTDLLIYYFSGTGNALSAARWIAEHARKKGIKAEIIPIDRFKKITVPPAAGRRLIGFCYPTHGFNLPWYMLKFIMKFPISAHCDAFLLNTRAGSKIFGWYAPGISGIAQVLPALILLMKRFRIRGMLPLDMPSNWISIHPGFKSATVVGIVARCRSMAAGFCERIFSGRAYYRPNVFIMLPVDLALAPIAFLYFIYGRFYLAKVFIASTDCDTCRLCEIKCPTASIKIIDRRPFWKFTCESCMRCINICPRKAIQTSHSLAVIISVISSLLPVALALRLLDAYIPPALARPVDFIIEWSVTISTIFIVSGAVFWLIRVKIINTLFTFTSLTKYWRRYLAPGIRPKDYQTKSALSSSSPEPPSLR